jgi:hypothetical protein
MQFIPFDDPRMRPMPPATVQLRDPIFTPEAAWDGTAPGAAKMPNDAKAITIDLESFMLRSCTYPEKEHYRHNRWKTQITPDRNR